jgi:GH15 family glucan-1,4-alpha-glucosidase
LPEIRAVRAAIAEMIECEGFDPASQTYRRDFDSDLTDASLLVMASVGYKDTHDPRLVSTFARIAAELRNGALIYRYPPGSDGLDGREGAFGLCSFWGVEYLARRGDLPQAEADFRELLTYANDVGLFSEEIAPATGAALGNFPQGFTHIGLINAAQALEQARMAPMNSVPHP